MSSERYHESYENTADTGDYVTLTAVNGENAATSSSAHPPPYRHFPVTGDHGTAVTSENAPTSGPTFLRSIRDNFSHAKQKDVLIAVMGMTGVGKSSFISRITGQNVKIGHNLQSCTQEIELAQCRIGDYNVTFVDTPGFDDTDRSDTDVLQSIATYLELSYDKNMRLSGLIYLHRITDARVTGSAMKNLKMFRTLCGENNMKNVVLATSMWGNVSEREGLQREKELTSTGKFWGGMIAMGARYFRWNETKESATEIASQIVHMAPIVLLLQEELKKNHSLAQTSAGKEVQSSLEKEMIRREEDRKLFLEQMQEAARTQNAAMMEESRKLYEEQIAAMRKANEDLMKLSRDQAESMQQRINDLQNQLNKKKGCIIS
ncbi:hypothetical protein RUND412_006868 [Rhizina undulata]